MRLSRATIAPPRRARSEQEARPGREAVPAGAVPSARPAQLGPAVWCDWLAPALAVVLFVALAARQWQLPGLYNDEAWDVIPAMQLVLGQPVELGRGVGLRLFGRDLPLMISDYQGVTSAYGVLPLFALFGPGVGATRGFTIGLGALALILTYRLGRALGGRPAGALAALLLAVSPSFIFFARVGVYVVIQVVPLALGTTLCFLRWRRSAGTRGRDGWLALAGLLVGLGLSTKVLFLWFIAGSAAAGAAVWLVEWRWPVDEVGRPRRRRSLRARLNEPLPVGPRAMLAAVVGFLLGAAPLIGYNLASGGTFKVVRANLVRTEKGADNTAVLANLAGRGDDFRILLDGSYFWFISGGVTFANRIMPSLFLLSAAGLLALVCAVPEFRRWRATTVFALTMIAAILVQSAFTLSGTEATHLLLLLPLPQLVIAAFALTLGRTLAHALARRGAEGAHPPLHAAVLALPALALLTPAILGDLHVNRHYHDALAQNGGYASFSPGIYDLAALLDSGNPDYDYAHPYALDWGMKYNVQLLTRGRVEPREIYGQAPRDTPPAEYAATIERLLDEPRAVYLAHRHLGPSAPVAYAGRIELLERLAAARGKQVVTLAVVCEGLGGCETSGPLFYVYAVRDR